MKRTALILAMTLAMAPMAHAQQAPATTTTPESTTTPGGGSVGAVNAGLAISGLVVLGAVIGLIAGSDDNASGVVATSTPRAPRRLRVPARLRALRLALADKSNHPNYEVLA